MIQWEWRSFAELSPEELYAIIAVREAVFVVEQDCAYLDADGLDRRSRHLMAWRDGELLAYLRLLEPGSKYPEASIGRVLTVPPVRGTGLGREMLARGVARAEADFPGTGIRISAQAHLEKFYAEFGFDRVSEPYDEDGILHIEMFRKGF